MPGKTLLWIGCGGCSGETQAMLGVEGQVSDLVDLIDVDSLRLLWHPSLADVDLSVVLQELLAGREHLSVLCVEGSIALADDGMFDIAGCGEVPRHPVTVRAS
jgi:Ni,Fe-hydrogenase I small subunit